MKKAILCFFTFIILLSSCAPARIIPTVTIIAPTPTKLLPIETLTPTSTFTPTPTQAPIGITEIASLGKGSANLVSWSPDGKYYAIGGSLGTHIYNANSHDEIKFFPQEIVVDAKFSPDGQLLGIESFKHLTIIRLSDERVLFDIESTQLSEIAFSPDSRLFAYVLRCSDRECRDSVHIYDISTDREITTLNLDSDPKIININQIEFDPHSNILAAAGSDNLVYMWNISTGEKPLLIKGHTNQVVGINFSPDGKLLASYGKDSRVFVWIVENGKRYKSFVNFRGTITGVTFSLDSLLIKIIVDDKTQITRNVATGETINTEPFVDSNAILLQKLRSSGGYIESVNGLAFSPEGQTLAVGYYASSPILLWDVSTRKIRETIDTSATILVYSHQGKLLASVDKDGNISIWDTSNYTKLNTIKTSKVDNIVFSPDDSYIAVSSKGKILIWNIQQDKIVQTINTGKEKTTRLSYSMNGDVISAVGGNDFSVKTWSTSTGEVVNTFTPPNNPDYRESVNLSNNVLAIFKQTGIENNVIELWDTNSGKKMQEFRGINDYIAPRLVFSPDRKVVAISYYYGITFYCSNTGKPIYTYDEVVNWVKFSFSPDGNYLAIGDDYGKIRMWDVRRIIQEPSCANP